MCLITIMTYLEQVAKGVTKLRRSKWPRRNYISLANQKEAGSLVSYWDNDSFSWKKVKLSLSELFANDWQEEK